MPLSAFMPLSEVSGVELVSLQKEIPERDLTALAELSIGSALQEGTDFMDTAEIIGKLDLVVSVDTAVAHLAASMGKPVWMILPEAADWRWGASGDRTVWYPTMRLIRHEKNGEHESVVSRIRHELACFDRAAA
jgi:ADP-heptose:LPS heptosyltransferase